MIGLFFRLRIVFGVGKLFFSVCGEEIGAYRAEDKEYYCDRNGYGIEIVRAVLGEECYDYRRYGADDESEYRPARRAGEVLKQKLHYLCYRKETDYDAERETAEHGQRVEGGDENVLKKSQNGRVVAENHEQHGAAYAGHNQRAGSKHADYGNEDILEPWHVFRKVYVAHAGYKAYAYDERKRNEYERNVNFFEARHLAVLEQLRQTACHKSCKQQHGGEGIMFKRQRKRKICRGKCQHRAYHYGEEEEYALLKVFPEPAYAGDYLVVDF